MPWERALGSLTYLDILWENIEAVTKRCHKKIVAVKCFIKSQENIRGGVLFYKSWRFGLQVSNMGTYCGIS